MIGEFFLPIHFQLMAVKGATLSTIRQVRSHVMGLGQCRNIIRKLGLKAVVAADTAGSAREVAERNDPTWAALAPRLAASIYGLDILMQDVEDAAHNTTRFVVLSPNGATLNPSRFDVTSFVFPREEPAGGTLQSDGRFATNGVNMTKLVELHGRWRIHCDTVPRGYRRPSG